MLKKILTWSLVLLFAYLAVSSYFLSRPLYQDTLDEQALNEMRIASRDQALTLARTRSGQALLVIASDADGISAVDIQAATGLSISDSLGAYREIGVQGLQALYGAPPTRVAWSELGPPLVSHYPHIAAGTNYRAHAEEVGLDGQPFLFPKLSHATAWNADVNSAARLDHEVELCAVPINDHSDESPATLGYLLCGDFTDRWTLVKDMDIGGKMGRTGFPTAKGGGTRLPVGPLLVIPFNEDFYQQIELRLFVNEALRQRATASSMVWSPQEILSNALADCQSVYTVGPDTVSIVDCDSIPAGTLVLTGTPEGVMFHATTLWNPWAYLQEGDIVTSFATYLGYTRNIIVKESVR